MNAERHTTRYGFYGGRATRGLFEATKVAKRPQNKTTHIHRRVIPSSLYMEEVLQRGRVHHVTLDDPSSSSFSFPFFACVCACACVWRVPTELKVLLVWWELSCLLIVFVDISSFLSLLLHHSLFLFFFVVSL